MEQLVRGEVDTDVALQLGSWHEELDLSHQNWASEMPDWWDRLCAALGASTVLRSLTISHVRLTQPQMQSLHGALKLNDSLTTLTLNDSCITDAALSALSPAFVVNTCLTTLRLAGNEVTNQGLAALFADILQTDTVTELDLSRNPLAEAGTQCLAAYVAHSTALAALSMAGTCPSQAALTAVCAALPQSRSLKKLDVCDMPLDMMLFAEQLVENRGITHLALSSCSVHVASLPMHRLRCLDIAGGCPFPSNRLLHDPSVSFPLTNPSLSLPAGLLGMSFWEVCRHCVVGDGQAVCRGGWAGTVLWGICLRLARPASRQPLPHL